MLVKYPCLQTEQQNNMHAKHNSPHSVEERYRQQVYTNAHEDTVESPEFFFAVIILRWRLKRGETNRIQNVTKTVGRS
jgi:hypothetical protein